MESSGHLGPVIEMFIKSTPYRRGFFRKLIVGHIIQNSPYFKEIEGQ